MARWAKSWLPLCPEVNAEMSQGVQLLDDQAPGLPRACGRRQEVEKALEIFTRAACEQHLGLRHGLLSHYTRSIAKAFT